MRRNLLRKLRGGGDAVPGRPRLRRVGGAAGGQRGALAAQHDPARAARPGQEPAAAQPHHAAGSRRSRRWRAARSTTIPFRPLCKRLPRPRGRSAATTTPVAFLTPDDRYVEKLATPDVTIADIIGDVDPIRAARGGHDLGSELTMHYGLLPRAHRGIFALNELPDLAGRIQVGPLQHPPGGRRPDQGLPDPPAPRRLPGLHRQPRGLHGPRQDHHAAQGPHRQRGAHPLPDHPRAGRRHHPAGGLDGARGRACASPASCARWSRAWPSPRAATRRSTSAAGSASACPSRSWRTRVSNAERRGLVKGESPGGAADLRHLRGPPLPDRQVRAGVRGGADGGGERGPRADPGGGGGGLLRLPGVGGLQGGGRVLRGRGQPEAARRLAVGGAAGPAQARARAVGPHRGRGRGAGDPAPLVAAAGEFVLEGL